MTRCRNLLLASLIISAPAFSGTIEVAQWIPWSFVSQEIISTPIEVAINEARYGLEIQELRPTAHNLSININGAVSELIFNQNGMAATKKLSAEISMSSLFIDQILRREFNGNIIEVHLQAKCTPIRISIQELQAKTAATYIRESNYWRPELNEVQMSIPQNAWSVSDFSCSGIGGVGEEVATQIKSALNNPSLFNGLMKSWLGEEVRKVFISSWNSLLMSTGKDIKVTGMARPDEKGLMVYGEIPTKTTRSASLPQINTTTLSTQNPQFILSDKGFETLLEDKFLAMAPQKYNLQKVDGFAKLMKSKMTQYFVWPDLRRFSSSTPFYLSSYTDQSLLTLKAESANQWTAYLNSNGVLQTEIGGSPIDYINFGMTVSTKMSVTVTDSKIKISNGSSELGLKWSYGLLYQMLYRPNNRIAVDILKGAINQFFSNQTVIQDLPVIRIDERELKLQNWSQHNNLITMDWL